MSKFSCALGNEIMIEPAKIVKLIKSNELASIIRSLDSESFCRVVSSDKKDGGIIARRGLMFEYTLRPSDYAYMPLSQVLAVIEDCERILGHSYNMQFKCADSGPNWCSLHLVQTEIIPGRFRQSQQLPPTLALHLEDELSVNLEL